MIYIKHITIEALLEKFSNAIVGEDNSGSGPPTFNGGGYAFDAIRLELEIMRLATKTLARIAGC